MRRTTLTDGSPNHLRKSYIEIIEMCDPPLRSNANSTENQQQIVMDLRPPAVEVDADDAHSVA